MAHATIENWLKTANGRAMDPDGAFGYQCVDLADQYAQDIFGVRWQECVGGVASAKDLLDRVPDKFWTRINNDPKNPNLIPIRGDLIVWKGDNVNPHGHVALVLFSDKTGVTVLQQDGSQRWLPAHIVRLAYYQRGTGHVAGWLRPKAAMIKPAPVKKVYVEKGDTLTSIAKQFYTTVARLKAANPGINYDLLRIGQALNL